MERIARCWHELADKRAVLLVQLPPGRLHGPDHEHLSGGSYSDADLRWWADRVSEWRAAGKDVFVYFNNDGGGYAVRNAAALCLMPGDA
ncbi:uncharacterized protein YecE (DUF72 family) [Arthrobacter sp. UYCu712]